MDLVEITYHDYLARHAEGHDIDCWLLYDWEKNLLRYYNYAQKLPIPISNICFSLEDDHVELYDSYFESEPHTEIIPPVEGRLTTLCLITTFKLKDAKVKGKICIRNESKPPIYSEYVLYLKNAIMKVIVGLRIDNKEDYCEDGYNYDHCIFLFSTANISFSYSYNSQKISVFDKMTDTSKRKLLEQYLLEYLTKDLCPLVKEFQLERLSIKSQVSDQFSGDYVLKNILVRHNRKLHAAFNNLANEIINLTNSLVDKTLLKVPLAKLFGISNKTDNQPILRIYKGFINNLNLLRMVKDKSVIVSSENDLVILHVPIEFEKLNLSCKEMTDIQLNETNDELVEMQSYTTEGAYFVISVKKLDPSTAEIKLLNFKIMNLKPLSDSKIDMTMDYLVSFAIEESIKPRLTEVLKNEKLNYLAINPDVEIEYYGNEFFQEDSEDEEY